MKIKDVLQNKKREKWITCTLDTSVQEALNLLKHSKKSSLPVLDGLKLVAFVDFHDILAFLIDITSEERGSRVTPPSRSLATDDMSIIAERSAAFQVRSIGERALHNYSRHDPLVTVSEDDPLSAALVHFARTGVHRVAVADAGGAFINVLSQSDIAAFLLQRGAPITELNAKQMALKAHKPLLCVRSDEAAIDAFTRLHESGYGGAGVVNDSGELVGSLSLTDVKGIDGNLLRLLDPVSTFMQHVRKDAGENVHRLSWVIDTCPANTLLRRMVEGHLHRIFVCDSHMKPVGVVTLTTICKLVLPQFLH